VATGFTNSGVADFGLAAAGTAGGTVNVSYTAPTGTTGSVVFAQTGGFINTTAIAATGTAVNALDISTVRRRQRRARLGRCRPGDDQLQPRFAGCNPEPLLVDDREPADDDREPLGARSRIQDADFAQETANLSRAQVLQQAGTAMVAQANQLPQQVLTLLR
jgi:flagellin